MIHLSLRTDIDMIYPLKDYEFVVVADIQSHEWDSLEWKSQKAVGISFPPFQHQLRNVTFRKVLDAMIDSPHYGRDRQLLTLHKLLRMFVTNTTSALSICIAQSAPHWLDASALEAMLTIDERLFSM